MLPKLIKQELRKSFQLERDQLLIAKKKELDKTINQKLIQLSQNSDYQNIHVFLPMRSEPNIFPFIIHLLDQGKNVVCPKSLPKGILENYTLKSLNQLDKGVFGTSFPSDSKLYTKSYDLIIIPGLAYSIENDRLGYGGGYYDRFLKNHSAAYKVAIAYNFQLVETLPSESHDIKMDKVITP